MKHTFKPLKNFVLFFCAVVLLSCKKTDNVSPTSSTISAREALPGFQLVGNFAYSYSPTATSGLQGPDFSNSNTVFYFNAAFNSSVTWAITINDITSGAIKTLTGSSQIINQANATWDGSHDGLLFFNAGDDVTATLSILGSNTTYASAFTINTAKVPQTSALVGNTIILDGMNDMTAIYGAKSWPSWVAGVGGAYPNNPPDNVYSGQVIPTAGFALTGALANFKPIEGSGSFRLYGQDDDFGYFICGIKRQTDWFIGNGQSPASPKVESFPASPQDLYINVYVYGTGDFNSQLNLTVEEDDNGDHHNNPLNEDIYQYTLLTSHSGWKLFTIPYSDFIVAASPQNGGNGNHRQETKLITAFGFNLNSSPPGQTCQVIFDLPSLSVGNPFNPSQF